MQKFEGEQVGIDREAACGAVCLECGLMFLGETF